MEALPFDNTLSSDLSAPGSPVASRKTDQTWSLETLKQKPALLWGGVGGVVVLVAVAAFAITRRGKRQVSYQPREASPVAVSTDTASLSAAATGQVAGGLPGLDAVSNRNPAHAAPGERKEHPEAGPGASWRMAV